MIAALFPLLTSSKKYNIICTQNKIHISKRFMRNARSIVRQGSQTYFNPNSYNITRPMSFIKAGRLKTAAPKPKVTDTDIKSKHVVAIQTFCKEPDCKNKNCSNLTNDCPSYIPQQGEQTIPPEGTSAAFESYIVGNTTHKIPSNKKGVLLDSQKDYKGNPGSQSAVIESNPPKVDSQDIKVDQKASNYLQNDNKHKAISNATSADHSSNKNHHE